jgi:hypothetical protein
LTQAEYFWLQLLNAISQVNRGLSATASQQEEIDQLARSLERLNPNKNSLAAKEINGKWRLEYTTSESILGTKRPPFARPSGPIYQTIGVLLGCWHCQLLHAFQQFWDAN